MRSKTAALIVAIALGLIATVALFIYVGIVTGSVGEDRQRESVYVTKDKVSAGKSADELLSEKLIEKRNIPKKFLPDDALTSLSDVDGEILAVKLGKGSQLSESDFKEKKEEGIIPLTLKKDQLAISVPVDKFSSVDGQIRPGDKIVIYASFEGATPETAFTDILLANIEVISAPEPKTGDSGSTAEAGKDGLTVALTPQEAEKLVFATENGTIWAALQPEDSLVTSPTIGTSFGSIFQ